MTTTLLIHLFFLLLCAALFYDARRHRGKSRSRVSWFCLLAVVVGYASFYVKPAWTLYQFQQWKSEHGRLKLFTKIDPGQINGIFVPHATCTTLCRDLLINGNVDFIETNANFVRTLSGDPNLEGKPYARWRLATHAEFCWDDQVLQQAAAISEHDERGLLAQGLCFLPTFVDELKSELNLSQNVKSENSSKGEYKAAEFRTYSAKLKIDGQISVVATSEYRWITLPSFPLYFWVKYYYVPIGPRIGRMAISHGIPSLQEFVKAITGFKMPLSTAGFGLLYGESSLETVERALNSPAPIVRWSAIRALCAHRDKAPVKFDAAIAQLLEDPNRWVAAAAENAMRKTGKEHQCGGTTRFHKGELLKGPFMNSRAAGTNSHSIRRGSNRPVMRPEQP